MKQNALVHQMQSATSYVHVLDFGKLGQASFSAEETKAVIDILGGVKHEDWFVACNRWFVRLDWSANTAVCDVFVCLWPNALSNFILVKGMHVC